MPALALRARIPCKWLVWLGWPHVCSVSQQLGQLLFIQQFPPRRRSLLLHPSLLLHSGWQRCWWWIVSASQVLCPEPWRVHGRARLHVDPVPALRYRRRVRCDPIGAWQSSGRRRRVRVSALPSPEAVKQPTSVHWPSLGEGRWLSLRLRLRQRRLRPQRCPHSLCRRQIGSLGGCHGRGKGRAGCQLLSHSFGLRLGPRGILGIFV
jgi:hypothetical protein